MKKSPLYLLLGVCVWACRTEYDVDGSQGEKKFVVNGLVTTLADSSRIILSYTSDNYRTGSVEYVSNAKVTVSDGDGNLVAFTPSLKNGKYTAYKGYAAKVGKKYRLTVVADGVAYEAYDTLLPVTPIKKLDYEKRILGNGELLYQVYYYVDKQQGTNYYKSIQYKNQTLYRFYNRLTVYVDVALNEKNNKLPASILHSKKDTARIDLLSLSEPAYKFYSDLNNILLNDGGMFTSVAANPISNISNGALGFFQASDNSHKEIIIDPK